MKKLIIILSLCAVLSAACFLSSVPSVSSIPTVSSVPSRAKKSDAGWIAFSYYGDIWLARTDRSEIINLTQTDSIYENNPQLSWDAQKIIYSDDQNNLYMTDRDQTDKHLMIYVLLKGIEIQYPSWSPDGKKIIYVISGYAQDGNYESLIYLYDINSNNNSLILKIDGGVLVSPVISPDGNKIAFGTAAIDIMDVDGTNPQTIMGEDVLTDELVDHIAWSKDGNKIAFSTTTYDQSDNGTWADYGNIYVMNADGSDLTNLTNNAPESSEKLTAGQNIFGIAAFPSWTDENQIIYLSNSDTYPCTFKPYMMNSDGTSVELLVDQEMFDMSYQPVMGKEQDSSSNQ